MTWLLGLVWEYIKSLAVSVPLFFAANLVLLLLGQTNAKLFLLTYRTRQLAGKLRPGHYL